MAQEATVSRESIEELGGQIASSMEDTLEAGSFSVTIPADVKSTLDSIEKSFESQNIQDILSAISKTEKIVDRLNINLKSYNAELGEVFEKYQDEKTAAEAKIEQLKKRNIIATMKAIEKDGQQVIEARILSNEQVKEEKSKVKDEFKILEKLEKQFKKDLELARRGEISEKENKKLLEEEQKLTDERERLTNRQQQLTITGEESGGGGLQAPDLTSGPLGPFFEALLLPVRLLEDLGTKLFEVGKFLFNFGKQIVLVGKFMGKQFMALGKVLLHPIKSFKLMAKQLKTILVSFVGFIAGLITTTIGFIMANLPMILLGAAIIGLIAALVVFKDDIFAFFDGIWEWLKNSKLGKLLGWDKTKEEKEDRKATKRAEKISKLEEDRKLKKGGWGIMGNKEAAEKNLMKLQKEENRYQSDKRKKDKIKEEEDKKDKKKVDEQIEAEEYTAKINEQIRGEEKVEKEKQIADIKTGVITPPNIGSNMPIINNSTVNNQTVGSSTVSIPQVIRNAEESFNRAAGYDV